MNTQEGPPKTQETGIQQEQFEAKTTKPGEPENINLSDIFAKLKLNGFLLTSKQIEELEKKLGTSGNESTIIALPGVVRRDKDGNAEVSSPGVTIVWGANRKGFVMVGENFEDPKNRAPIGFKVVYDGKSCSVEVSTGSSPLTQEELDGQKGEDLTLAGLLNVYNPVLKSLQAELTHLNTELRKAVQQGSPKVLILEKIATVEDAIRKHRAQVTEALKKESKK